MKKKQHRNNRENIENHKSKKSKCQAKHDKTSTQYDEKSWLQLNSGQFWYATWFSFLPFYFILTKCH